MRSAAVPCGDGPHVPEGRRGVPREGPGLPRRHAAIGVAWPRRAPRRGRPGVLADVALDASRERAARSVVADRVRRRRAERARAGDPRRGVHRGRRARRPANDDVRHPDGRQHHPPVGHRGAEGATSSRGSSRARTSGARATRSRTPAPTSPNVGCRAVLDGDEWVINGQKIWTSARPRRRTGSSCSRAPTRTLPKHKGIIVPPGPDGPARRRGPTDQDDDRATRSSTRSSSPTPARPAANVVGRGQQRVGGRHDAARLRAGRGGRDAARSLFRSELDRLLDARPGARTRPDDPLIRQRLAELPTRRWRSCGSSGCGPSPKFLVASSPVRTPPSSSSTGASTTKVVAELAVDILGADALTPAGRRP